MTDHPEEGLMRSSLRFARVGVAVAVLALIAAACGNGGGGDGGGTIRIDGSSTVAPLSEAAAELFQNENSGTRVTVGTSGTGGGFEKFCNGETEISDASRPIEDDEIAACEGNGITFDEVQVANDALSLLVNNDNPVDCLTVEQARQIWDEGSPVSTWGDVDGLDAPAEFLGTPLTLYGPGTDSGTFDYFTEAINGEEGRIRTDYNDIGEDDAAAVTGVQGDAGAMGYVPYSYFQEAGDAVKPLQIDDGNGCVEATLENVQSGTYTPLGRPLFIYPSGDALGKQVVLDFITFYIDNADEIAEAASFIPLTQEQVDASLAKVEELAGG
ncbi:MAG TPA: phosphate ABC transporter substrate-binding protein PstS family protein [Acidimicrobiia bacterium]|nr:phosphate ABC transporter substrate-binding protein PstS family protein [Acidimicrobiia bacterium]